MANISVKEHQNLAQFNTMGIPARARYFVSIHTVEEVQELLRDNKFENIKRLVLGGGSNLLFISDFDGLIIHNHILSREIITETDSHILIKAGGGENWHSLVLHAIENGWGGIENLSLIPGSVGAAPIQNIGAYGVELKEVFYELEAVHLQTGEVKIFDKQACEFGYRDSIFKNKLKNRYLITSVTLKLQKEPQINLSYKALAEKIEEKGIKNPGIKEVSDAVIEVRKNKLPDPSKIGNTGSFFKNPVISQKVFEKLKSRFPEIPHYPADSKVKIPAAWLIEKCGWKGKRIGDAGVHEMQALVIVNYGKATGEEIWNLAQAIKSSVRELFGVELTPEVNVV